MDYVMSKTPAFIDTYMTTNSGDLIFHDKTVGLLKGSSHFASIWAEGNDHSRVPVDADRGLSFEDLLDPVSSAYADAVYACYPMFSSETVRWTSRLGVALTLPCNFDSIEERCGYFTYNRGHSTHEYTEALSFMYSTIRDAGRVDPDTLATQIEWAVEFVDACATINLSNDMRSYSRRDINSANEVASAYLQGYFARYGA